MKKALCVIFHILGYPLLLAAVLYFNWNIMMSQVKNYGVFVFVGVIVAVVMALIYYICYAAITSKKKKKRKTIFNQTVRLCMAVVIPMTGLWCLCDIALPDFLADATSSTIYYEDLADNWKARADVNEELLNNFIYLSVKTGTLPKPEGMDDEAAVEYYQKLGYNKAVKELEGNEYYKSISGLFAIQYQSINADGYQTFTHPWIDFATSDRLTIPCLVHLLLDKREISQESIKDYKYTEVTETEDGKKEVTTVFFAVVDKKTNTIELKDVNWTVLDMLGADNDVELDAAIIPKYGALIGQVDIGTVPAVNELVTTLTKCLAADEILGGDINVLLSSGDGKIKITLRPTTGYLSPEEFAKTNHHKGVLGYQEMAWLDSNGLVYALVTLFSTRKIFLIFAAWGVFINIMIGVCRGMCKEEKEKRRRLDAIKAPEKTVARTPSYGPLR